jgi:hypothetical protein
MFNTRAELYAANEALSIIGNRFSAGFAQNQV